MPTDIANAAPPSLWRRLAAMFYDAWLLAALWLLGATGDFFVRQAIGLGTDGTHLPLQIYLAACPFLFYGWFWTHGGQTLGMRAWRLKAYTDSGEKMDWRRSVIRVAAAHLSLFAAGLGYLWILVDRDRLAWHDRLSRTRVVMTAKG